MIYCFVSIGAKYSIKIKISTIDINNNFVITFYDGLNNIISSKSYNEHNNEINDEISIICPKSKIFILIPNGITINELNVKLGVKNIILKHIDNTFDKEINYNNNNINKNINSLFNDMQIYQIKISRSLLHFDRIKIIYNLENYYDMTKPCLFFGIYDNFDLITLQNHTGKKYLMWGGTDCNSNIAEHNQIIKKIKEYNDILHISISDDIKKSLEKYNIDSTLISFSLLDKSIFKPIDKKGNKIFIYNGYTKGHEYIYGKNVYEKVINTLPEFEYVYSNTLNVPYQKMPNEYSNCFIGLRLTSHDGNANMVQELNQMNIPVIHNGSGNNIKWKSWKDVVINIINQHNKLIEEQFYGKNILIIGTDFPGYGGAGTGTLRLSEKYETICNNVFTYFINDENINFNKKNILIGKYNNIIKIVEQYFDSKIDAVIFRNWCHSNEPFFEEIYCKKYFFIPGIFKSQLNKSCNNLSYGEFMKFVNGQVISMIKKCDVSYANSFLTKQLLMKYLKINVNIYHFNYLDFNIINNIHTTSRKYKYGFICSECDRIIKNAKDVYNLFEKYANDNKIVIGNGSEMFSNIPNTKIVNFISLDKIPNYLEQIDTLVCLSYYDSCSNVINEAMLHGCNILTNENCGNIKIY